MIQDLVARPAVEMQAIDRAHRIGQERPVFAYRLIARDTVEEKVLELQKTKRDLGFLIPNPDFFGLYPAKSVARPAIPRLPVVGPC